MEPYFELIEILKDLRLGLIHIHREASLLDGFGDIQRKSEWLVHDIDNKLMEFWKRHKQDLLDFEKVEKPNSSTAMG
jgi:hypothetical protein